MGRISAILARAPMQTALQGSSITVTIGEKQTRFTLDRAYLRHKGTTAEQPSWIMLEGNTEHNEPIAVLAGRPRKELPIINLKSGTIKMAVPWGCIRFNRICTEQVDKRLKECQEKYDMAVRYDPRTSGPIPGRQALRDNQTTLAAMIRRLREFKEEIKAIITDQRKAKIL